MSTLLATLCLAYYVSHGIKGWNIMLGYKVILINIVKYTLQLCLTTFTPISEISEISEILAPLRYAALRQNGARGSHFVRQGIRLNKIYVGFN